MGGEAHRSAAVVMVSFHTGPALWAALGSALAEPDCARLVLVDNGNDAETLSRLRRMAAAEPRLHLVTGQGNVGFATACNLGAAAAGGDADTIVFMNPDCELPAGALHHLRQALAADPAAWIAAPLLVDETGAVQAGTPRNALTPASIIGQGLGLHRLLPAAFPPLNRHREAMGDAPFAVPACSGALFAIRRDRFAAIGGFDEGFFLHVEDLDLCRRVTAAGGRILCLPALRVLHHGATSRAAAAVVEGHKTAGFARYLTRHFGSGFGIRLLIAAIRLRYRLRFPFGA